MDDKELERQSKLARESSKEAREAVDVLSAAIETAAKLNVQWAKTLTREVPSRAIGAGKYARAMLSGTAVALPVVSLAADYALGQLLRYLENDLVASARMIDEGVGGLQKANEEFDAALKNAKLASTGGGELDPYRAAERLKKAHADYVQVLDDVSGAIKQVIGAQKVLGERLAATDQKWCEIRRLQPKVDDLARKLQKVAGAMGPRGRDKGFGIS